MNQRCIISQNGGNNYMEKVKEKIKKEFFLQESTSRQIYILWDNTSKMDKEI